MRLGRFQESLDSYRKALALDPFHQTVWTNLPLVHEGLGQVREALEAGERCRTLHPSHVQGILNYGSVLIRAGQLEEATALFWDLYEVRPDEERLAMIMVSLLAAGDARAAAAFGLDLQGRGSAFLKHISRFIPTLVQAVAAEVGDGLFKEVCQLRIEFQQKKVGDQLRSRWRRLLTAAEGAAPPASPREMLLRGVLLKELERLGGESGLPAQVLERVHGLAKDVEELQSRRALERARQLKDQALKFRQNQNRRKGT